MSSHFKGKFYPLSWREHHLPQGGHVGGAEWALTDAVAALLCRSSSSACRGGMKSVCCIFVAFGCVAEMLSSEIKRLPHFCSYQSLWGLLCFLIQQFPSLSCIRTSPLWLQCSNTLSGQVRVHSDCSGWKPGFLAKWSIQDSQVILDFKCEPVQSFPHLSLPSLVMGFSILA